MRLCISLSMPQQNLYKNIFLYIDTFSSSTSPSFVVVSSLSPSSLSPSSLSSSSLSPSPPFVVVSSLSPSPPFVVVSSLSPSPPFVVSLCDCTTNINAYIYIKYVCKYTFVSSIDSSMIPHARFCAFTNSFLNSSK